MKQNGTTLVVGGTGKTGRRVVDRLQQLGLPYRLGSRSAEPPFDWENEKTWSSALKGLSQAYVTYYPDVCVPGALEKLRSFFDLAVQDGVKRLVFLSGRGEVEAERAERALKDSGAEWTIRVAVFSIKTSVRASSSNRSWLGKWLCRLDPWASHLSMRRTSRTWR